MQPTDAQPTRWSSKVHPRRWVILRPHHALPSRNRKAQTNGLDGITMVMPYIITPRWARLLQRTLFSLRYLLLGAAGMVAVFQPGWDLLTIGVVLIVGAWVALIGVGTGRFALELVPLWFLIAALTWAASILFSTGRWTTGVLVIALVPALAERLLHLMLVASRARRIPAVGESHGGE